MTLHPDPRLLAAYERAGVTPGRVVYLTARPDLDAEAYIAALQNLLGPGGTIVMSSATPSLLDSEAPFDATKTPAENHVAEALRRQPEARRSLHPFDSYVALGAEACSLVDNTGPHTLGPETPPGRLVASNALAVIVGLPAPATQPARRLAEFSMAVPWRYVREMLHPVMRNGRVEIETFYVHVPYRGIGLDIDEGEALFDRVCAAGLAMQTADANGTPVTGLGMAAYYRLACAALRRDLYIGCIAAPTNLPYRT